MTKSIAKVKLASAIKRRDKEGVREVYRWAKNALSPKAFAIMFIKDIERLPSQDYEWFRQAFSVNFVTATGNAYRAAN